jgi:ATP/maltotriose-dependent transcriptional regulator MalT
MRFSDASNNVRSWPGASHYDQRVLYGRDGERDEIGALLEAARNSRSGVLVLHGEAGIGKTALLQDTRERAADMHVLTARGIESESELPFAALHQLLRPALRHLDQLPPPQAAALRAALGLAEGGGEERFLAFAACLSLLSELAEQRPVLCLIDDAHWLDEASADALRFVARRLDAEGIVFLFAARDDVGQPFDAGEFRRLQLDGLDAEAAALLLSRGAGVDASPAVRERLVERTRGNALALLELPAALTREQLAGDEPLPEALPMTRQLERVFLQRVQGLPDGTQRLLVVAAADDSEDLAVVTRAAATLGSGPEALDAAEEAGLVSVHGRRIVFHHPLVRSAVYAAATSGDRRAAHGALAAALAGDDEQADRRVWHLAASALERDEDVLRALDEAAERAEERNGHSAAAKALERAAELTADPAERGHRLVRAAANLSLAGRDEQAVAIAGRAGRLVDEPALRAELAHVHTLAAIRRGRPGDVVPVLMEAARPLVEVDPPKAMQLLVDAADAVWQGGDRAGYLEVTSLAATIDVPAGDETTAFFARSLAGFAAMIEGETAAGVELLREVEGWGTTAGDPRHVIWASFAAQWLAEEERWGALVDRAGALARQRGELGILADTLGMRASRLALEQRFDEAAVAATEAVRLARELRADNLQLYPLAALAMVAAVRGHDDDARRDATSVVELATANGLRLRASTAVYALALLDLGRARWLEALTTLDSLHQEGSGALDPTAGFVFLDKIEAAVRASRPDVAEAVLPQFELWVDYAGTPSAHPRLAACRALLAADTEAPGHFETALELSGDARPFDLARIRLLYGEHLRRMRRRLDAREQLRASLDAFEKLGAAPWAERARTELRASGETARKRDPSTVSQLTPQERQVARLVGEGFSNKEVAAQLFLSPRTIDAHLRNVFSKLGVTSRTQLARLALGGEGLAA